MRLIDADAPLEQAYIEADKTCHLEQVKTVYGVDVLTAEKIARAYMHSMPTVDPVKRGHWIKSTRTQEWAPPICLYECSLCGYREILIATNYCADCGAKMDEEADNGADS